MAYTYEPREVSHGDAFSFFSAITQDIDTGDVVFGPVYEFTGLRATSFETTQDTTTFYADNVEHIKLSGISSTEGSITTYQIRRDFLIDHLGKLLTNSTPPALLDTGTRKNFVFGYAETITTQLGSEFDEWHIWTNLQASPPSQETATDEDAIEPKEIEIPVSASPNSAIVDVNGKAVTHIIIRDPQGLCRADINNLFGDTPSMTMQAFLEKYVAGEETTPPEEPVTP